MASPCLFAGIILGNAPAFAAGCALLALAPKVSLPSLSVTLPTRKDD